MAGRRRRPRGLEATRVFASVAPRIYWCSSCGVPLLRARCPKCGGRGRPVDASLPRDVRPAYPRDVEELRRAIERSYGGRVASRLAPYLDGVYLLNRIQHYEAADEVFTAGYRVGVRFYDPFTYAWRFRVGGYGAAILLEEGLPGHAWVRGRLRRGAFIDSSMVEELVEPEGDAEWLAVGDEHGNVGVARMQERGLRIQAVYGRLRAPKGRLWAAGMSTAVEVNKPVLEEMEEEAIGFLRREISGRSGAVVIAYGGGKDSTIAAHLAVMAGVRRAVYVDTGLEHPETLEMVEAVEDRLGLELEVFRAGNAFWETLPRMGPPARDYRWCTRIVKLSVMARGYRRLGYDRIIVVTGQRALESPARAAAGRVAETGPPNPRGVMLAPIQYWCSLAEHLYIALRGLPLHPLYREGFDRIGCYMCPTGRIPEFRVTMERHPELWGRWEGWLRRYASSRRLPAAWLRLHLWRWRSRAPGDLIVAARRRMGLDVRTVLEKAVGVPATVDTASRPPEVLILDANDPEPWRLEGFLHALGYETSSGDGVVEARRGGRARIRIERGPRIRAWGGFMVYADAVTAVYMASECLGEHVCRLCYYICPRGAVGFQGGRAVIGGGCDACKKCIGICPVGLRAASTIRFLSRRFPGRRGEAS